jgi:mannitol/fructose-specific phosphotransferase system IIA component (Ntr-type)
MRAAHGNAPPAPPPDRPGALRLRAAGGRRRFETRGNTKVHIQRGVVHMALIDLISEDIVKVPLVSTNKPDVLRELVGVLRDAGRIGDFDGVLDAVQQREFKGSTGLELGIAVPHAKTSLVSSLTVAIGVSPAGVDFDSIDRQPSHLFFLLLAATDQSGPHVEALREIAQISKSPAFLRGLIGAQNAKEVVELMRD